MKFAYVSIYSNVISAHWIGSGCNCMALPLLQAGHEVDYHSIKAELSTIAGDYDVYVISVNDIKKVSDLVNTIKPSGAKIVAFTDGVSQRFEYIRLDMAVKARAIFEVSDVIITNSLANYYYFQTWYGEKVKCVGLPVNIDFIAKIFGQSNVIPEDNLVWQGYFSDFRPHHNTLYQIQIAQQLGLRSLLTTDTRDEDYASQVQEMLHDMGLISVEVYRAASPDGFLGGYLKRCSYAMYFPQRPSLGRTPAECAVVGIPCLGTRNYFQEELFPDLTFDRLCDGISDKLVKLIREKDYRDEVLAYARKRVELYRPDVWYKKFEEACL